MNADNPEDDPLETVEGRRSNLETYSSESDDE